jgi:predicted nuclease with RNAse H fold
MHIVGIDLSGPSNWADTALLAFDRYESGLRLQQEPIIGATDVMIYNLVAELADRSQVAVGIDAPLSYNIGGGDRPSDADLRRHTIAAGLHPGSVMVPTLTRMVYLTLRGMSVARSLLFIPATAVHIVEVHPGAAMALRGAPVDAVRTFKDSEESRRRLLDWLEEQGLDCIATEGDPSDHYVAACAAALAAWKWYEGESVWCYAASAPFHPFDYAC